MEEPDPEELLPEEELPDALRDFFVLFDFELEELPDTVELLSEDAFVVEHAEESVESASAAEEAELSEVSAPADGDAEESEEAASEAAVSGSSVEESVSSLLPV